MASSFEDIKCATVDHTKVGGRYLWQNCSITV